MKVLCFDIETTDLIDFKKAADAPDQARICALAAVLFSTDALTEHGADNPERRGLIVKGTIDSLIKPDGWHIKSGAAAVNGLTVERCEAEGQRIADVMADLEVLWAGAALVIGYGVDYDLKGVRGEWRRLDKADRYGEKPKFCVMRGCQKAIKLNAPNAMDSANKRKMPTLTESMRILLDSSHEKAHTAINDVWATIRLFHYLRRNGFTEELMAPRPDEPGPDLPKAVAPVF